MILIIFLFLRLMSVTENIFIDTNASSYILLSKNVNILPESKMYLKGKTNLSDYSCECISAKILPNLVTELTNNKVSFNHALLEINTSSINCHNSIYNYNIKNSLDSKNYPIIKIELIEAWKKNLSNFIHCEEWFDLVSLTKVTVKNKTLQQYVEAKATQLSPNKYRIVGNQTIYMQDYNIKTPEIMFGLIQIDNKIEFYFDLILEVS